MTSKSMDTKDKEPETDRDYWPYDATVVWMLPPDGRASGPPIGERYRCPVKYDTEVCTTLFQWIEKDGLIWKAAICPLINGLKPEIGKQYVMSEDFRRTTGLMTVTREYNAQVEDER